MQLRWYFDFVSPFAYLHWQRLKALPQFDQVQPVPIVFGAVLQGLGVRGPAEIPGKRLFTYRQVLWQSRRDGVRLRFPPTHPFNSLAALRLCVAAGTTTAAVDHLFNWIWRDGHAGDSAAALGLVGAMLDVADVTAAIAVPAIKQQLRDNTEAAIAAGVFGVPTLSIDGELFWGNEAHPLMQAVLEDPGLLQSPEWLALAAIPVGLERTA